MKNAMPHLRNNFWLYFIVLSAALSIISIIAGAAALKADQYGDPFLAAVPLSNACFFLIANFFNNPKFDSLK